MNNLEEKQPETIETKTLDFDIVIYVSFTKDVTEKIFLDSGKVVSGFTLNLKPSADKGSLFRKHFRRAVLTEKHYNASIEMDKESYCVEDVYAAWLAHTRSAYMKYISNHGDSGLKLLDILSEKEMRECLIKYEYKLAEKAAAIEAEKLAKESEISRKEYFPDTYQLLIEDEASINHPLEKLEKNWFCVVQGKDNLAPGGLSRTFFQKSRGRGTHFIIPNGFINPGDMVEVGTSNLYGKITHKKFFVAVMVYDSKILFADCMDEEHMFRYSVYWKSNFKKSTEYEMKYVHGLIMEKVDAIGNLLKTVDADSCKQIIEDIDEKLDILFDEKSRIGKILTGENK